MKKTYLVAVVLIVVASSSTLMSECFSDSSSIAHFHYIDGTQFQYKNLKHWLPDDQRDFSGTYQASGGGGGIVIVAHLSDSNNTHSKSVFSGSIVEQDGGNSAPSIHSFQNLEIKDGKIGDSKFSGIFYRFPHYENQTEYFFIKLENMIYVRAKTVKRKIAIDEVEQAAPSNR